MKKRKKRNKEMESIIFSMFRWFPLEIAKRCLKIVQSALFYLPYKTSHPCYLLYKEQFSCHIYMNNIGLFNDERL